MTSPMPATPQPRDIRRVGIVGCGVMGTGIAETCASSGVDVLVAVSSRTSMAAARQRLTDSLDRRVRRGKLSAEARESMVQAISFTTSLGDLADRELIMESVPEDEYTKRKLFQALDEIVEDPDVILASNTSSIPIVTLGRATSRAGNVVGTHFFNPAPVQPLVELVDSLLTDQATSRRVERFLTDTLGKRVIRSADRAGFVVNALLIPYLLDAVRMVESGFATAADIDKGMTLGCAHPIGPLALVDLIGLDTVAAIAGTLHREFRDQRYATPPLLARMAEAGLLGKKTGEGFHHYPR